MKDLAPHMRSNVPLPLTSPHRRRGTASALKLFGTCLLACIVCSTAIAADQGEAVIQPHEVVQLWPGDAPGSEQARQVEKDSLLFGDARVTRNVVKPTLTVYLPTGAPATGTGIVVAPGGGFRFLMMDSEGHDVARWLAARGIAAFVLKYRLVPTPANDEEFVPKFMQELLSWTKTPPKLDKDAELGVADGLAALKLVRERAREWGVDPDRIGIMGFSAGAMVTTLATLRAPADARPRFAAPIYGAAFGELPSIPANMPPVFLAYASDDDLVQAPVRAFYDALRAADQHPELHVYRDGGHGFGLRKQGKSSDFWIEDFYNWLGALGLTTPAAGR